MTYALKGRVEEAYKMWLDKGSPKNVSELCKHFNTSERTMRRWLQERVVDMGIAGKGALAARQGFSPEHDMVHTVPAPFVVKGTSTLYKDGVAKLQWVKTKLDEKQVEVAIRDFIQGLVEDARGLSPVIAQPTFVDKDLLVVYPMGDPHLGMYSWSDETGDNFDLGIAERLLCAAVDRLVDSAPPSETALIAELGDFFHSDNDRNQTKSGHALDVDTRWAKVMQIGLRTMVYCIKKALTKHEKVIVRIVKGNHDGHSSFALALALDAYFSNNDRVKIDLSPAAHWYYRFGQVLIGITHGDTSKMSDLPAVMADDRSEDWGLTKFRYWYQGHIHHQDTKEYRGVVVEAFRTLAAKDAWHAAQGYRSGRDMRCIVHHKDYGEIERHRCDISMLKDAA